MSFFPKEVRSVLHILHHRGYEAYLVGGCVRDLLLGRTPDDWDVTTSACPEEVMALFKGRCIPTGLKHGTVSVLSGRRRLEVTTYRLEGEYTDNRRPDAVQFTGDLREDLKRRDLTVNAMAMSLDGQLTDLFGGREDLKNRTIRCVGVPEERYNEDALRIMRALRFSSTLNFTIEPDTARGIRSCRENLRNIAVERILMEMTKLLCGERAAEVLLEFPEVIGVFLPEILPAVDFTPRGNRHCYGLWEHTARAVAAAPQTPVLRWTMLLHDLAKPDCLTWDEKGEPHMRGHQQLGAERAVEICRRLRMNRRDTQRISTLIAWHDREIPRTRRGVVWALNELGEETLRQLLEVKRADTRAKSRTTEWILSEIDRVEEILNELLREGGCLRIGDLAVCGKDLQHRGIRGAAVGTVLRQLLGMVAEKELPNERAALLQWIRENKKKYVTPKPPKETKTAVSNT